MATTAQAKAFIAEIGPIIQSYAKAQSFRTCSTIIAQACCESAFGTSSLGYKYHNYFGMKCGSSWKGASVNMTTKEEYKVGTLTTIRDNFRVYDSMEAGVAGYFGFVSASRYANLKDAISYKDYAEKLKADGYATSSTYVKTLCSIVEKYGLTAYDNGTVQPAAQQTAAASSVKIDAAQKLDKALAGTYKTTAALHLRSGAGTSKASLAVMPQGATVKCYGYYSMANGVKWYYVQYGSMTGFCSSQFLKK